MWGNFHNRHSSITFQSTAWDAQILFNLNQNCVFQYFTPLSRQILEDVVTFENWFCHCKMILQQNCHFCCAGEAKVWTALSPDFDFDTLQTHVWRYIHSTYPLEDFTAQGPLAIWVNMGTPQQWQYRKKISGASRVPSTSRRLGGVSMECPAVIRERKRKSDTTLQGNITTVIWNHSGLMLFRI